MAMGMGPSSPEQNLKNVMGMGASQANNTQNNRVGDFGTSREQQMAAANETNEARRNTNTAQPIGMGAGTGQQKAIDTNNQAMQGQGVTAVGPQVGANGKVQTGFGDTRQQQIDREMAKNAEMVVKNADAQNTGLAKSMDLMGQRSAKKTEMEDPSAPVDYNAVYNTEAEIFNQKQASDWNNRMDFMSQRAKERGMEGTDLSAYLSHMELGNRMGLLDARQSMMLEGLHKDMAFKEKGYWQDRADDKDSYNQYMELLNASWGDEQAVQGILEMAADSLGADSYFGQLLKNPDALRNLNDAGYNELFQQRNLAASNVLREMNDPLNMGEINATFNAYKNAKYGSAMDINIPSDLTINDLDPEIYADYAEEFGAINWEDPSAEDIKNVYAYQQYRKDVKNSLEDEVAIGLVNDFLTNGGNPETAEKIRNLGTEFTFSLMEDESLSNYIGGQVDADDPINGPLAFMFSDWEGNVYADENDYQNKQSENKGLDLKWQDYMRNAAANGETPISRWEWLDAVTQVSTPGEVDNLANSSDVNAKVNAYLAEKQSDIPVDEYGNEIEVNTNLFSYDSDTGEYTFSKQPSEMNITERLEAANTLPMDSPQFTQVVANMHSNDYQSFVDGLSDEQVNLLDQKGYVTQTIDDLDLSWSDSIKDLKDKGIGEGRIVGTKDGMFMIVGVDIQQDDDHTWDLGLGENEVKLSIQGKKLDKDGNPTGDNLTIFESAEDGWDNAKGNINGPGTARDPHSSWKE